MKKLSYLLFFVICLLIPTITEAKISTTTPCDAITRDGQLRQIKTCYIDITVSGEDSLYSVSGSLELINTSLSGGVQAVDSRIKITNSNLSNLTFTSEVPIKNETIRIAKFTVYLATNGQGCYVYWKPTQYIRNLSCDVINGYYYDKNGNAVSKDEYSMQCEKHICEIYNGTYFDKNGNKVSKDEYSIQCENHSCEVINGTYFDKNGNQVSKDEYSFQCEKHTCEVINNTYFDKDGNQVSKDEYHKQCEKKSCEIVDGKYYDKDGNETTEKDYKTYCEKHTCEVYYGVSFDNNGNVVSAEEYEKACTKHYCEVVDGSYYDKSGIKVSEQEYDKQCNPHFCKIIDNTHFGKNGNIVDADTYAVECPNPNPSTGISGFSLYAILAALVITFGFIVKYYRSVKKNNL